MFGLLSSGKSGHPLTDAKELRRVIESLPAQGDAAAVDEVTVWLESLGQRDDLRPDVRFDIVAQLDAAALVQARRLARDYVNLPRAARTQQGTLWDLNHNYWTGLGHAYARCLTDWAAGGKGAAALSPQLAALCVRSLHACLGWSKWTQLRYRRVDAPLWMLAGQAYLAAVNGGIDAVQVELYPGAATTASSEYLRLMMFHASSMSSLRPQEIEIAERFITHCLSRFGLSTQAISGSSHWVDAEAGKPPVRLFTPPVAHVSVRYFGTGNAAERIAEIRAATLERGAVPTEINLGASYPVETILAVCDHLALNWSPKPPLRAHQRHRLSSSLAAVGGLPVIVKCLQGGSADAATTWSVDDVSMGGMAARMALSAAAWVHVGAVVGMQPAGGNNWLVGAIRRFARIDERQGEVGIETLSKSPRAVMVDCHGLRHEAILLDPPVKGTVIRVLMADTAWEGDLGLDFLLDGAVVALHSQGLAERGYDFVIGNYTVG